MLIIWLLTLLSIDSLYYDLRIKKELDHTAEAYKITVTVNPLEGLLYLYDYTNGHLYERSTNDSLVLIDVLDYRFLGQSVIEFVEEKNSILITDSGLGRVHLYDLDTNKLNRLDESYILRAFWGFSGFRDGTNITAIGGEGEFIRRNQLIEFRSEDGGEWWEVMNSNQLPPNELSYNFKLFKGRSDDELIFTKTRNQYLDIYQLIDKSSFIELGSFEFDQNLSKNLKPISFSNFTSIGDNQHMFDEYFYNLSSNQILKVNIPDLTENIFGIYQAEVDSVLIVYWQNFGLNPNLINGLKLKTISSSELSFTPLNNKVKKLSKAPIIFGVLLFVLIILVVIQYYRKRVYKKKLLLNDNILILEGLNKPILLEDPIQIKFITLVIHYYEKGLKTMPLEIFDSIFSGLSIDKSNESRRRKKMIESINSKVGFEFITMSKDSFDNRKKVINIRF